MTDYSTPPTDLWEIDERLQFNQALEEGDPRYVPTHAARGDYSLTRLFRTLGVDDRDSGQLRLRTRHRRSYTLFCGHRGCGKSTELRRIATRLHTPHAFYVVLLDAAVQLDPHNLEYADVFLALAKALFEALQASGIELDNELLYKLQEWFKERIETDSRTKQFAAEVKAGVKIEGGIPFFAKLFGSMQTSIKDDTHYKQELRSIVKNTFSQFASAFNFCIQAAEDALAKVGRGHKILFIVDGTDRLNREDGRRFFIEEVHQLMQIEANIVYSAPIHLLDMLPFKNN